MEYDISKVKLSQLILYPWIATKETFEAQVTQIFSLSWFEYQSCFTSKQVHQKSFRPTLSQLTLEANIFILEVKGKMHVIIPEATLIDD